MTLLVEAAAEPSCYSRLTNDWLCWQYVTDRRSELVDATIQLLGLTVAAVVAGLVIAYPLALPVVMAGLRVATVSTVALTTVGSLVAYGGLGNLIKDGVLTNFRAELFTASVLCVLLAVVFDALLVLMQRVLTPWNRGVRA